MQVTTQLKVVELSPFLTYIHGLGLNEEFGDWSDSEQLPG